MMFPVLFFILCATLAESLDEGESCSFANGNPGVCALLINCKSVIQQLRVGNSPDKICGYSGIEPIVCCPSSAQTNLTSDERGAISRQKCTEYARSVYVEMESPILAGKGQLVNVSQCATASRNLIGLSPRAEPGEFPYMAAVGFDLETGDIGWYCGGALISETFVLTAAHCTYSAANGKPTWVRLGSLNLMESAKDRATPVDRRIVEQIRHPEYKPPSIYHDIALLRLETRVPFNRLIRPACLHTESSTVETTRVIATEWHLAAWSQEEDTYLIRTSLPVVNSKTCNTSFITSDIIGKKLSKGVVDEWMICAGDNNKDSCQSDTGGPLVIFSKKEYCMYDVVGVTSVGAVCGSTVPGIHTRVYNYVPWIESVVWKKG